MILQDQKKKIMKITVCPILMIILSTLGSFYRGKVCKASEAMEGDPVKTSPSLARGERSEAQHCWFSFSQVMVMIAIPGKKGRSES